MAIDHTAWQIIEKQRAERGLKTLLQAGTPPKYIAVAADPQHKLGTNDPNLNRCSGGLASCQKLLLLPKTPRPRLDCREALLRILRLAGLSAGTAAVGYWLSTRSARPSEKVLAVTRHSHTIPPNAAFPELAVITGDSPLCSGPAGLAGAWRHSTFHLSRRRGHRQAQHCLGYRTPEQAANTNPEVVAEMVRQCWSAGAQESHRHRCQLQRPASLFPALRHCRSCSGRGRGSAAPRSFEIQRSESRGDLLEDWPVFQPFLEADKIINLPIAKHHSLTGTTLGMKNWYGILGGQRHRLHQGIHESLADLADFVRPTLTMIDSIAS